jgi:hypothetical protein
MSLHTNTTVEISSNLKPSDSMLDILPWELWRFVFAHSRLLQAEKAHKDYRFSQWPQLGQLMRLSQKVAFARADVDIHQFETWSILDELRKLRAEQDYAPRSTLKRSVGPWIDHYERQYPNQTIPHPLTTRKWMTCRGLY